VQTTDDDKVELNETLSLILSNLSAGGRAVTFSGGGGTLSGTGTILNNDSATLTIGGVSVDEGGDLVFTVTLSHAVQGGLTVGFATTDGTATLADSDYAQTSGTLTFDGTAGEQQTITVPTTHDTKVEPDETLTVALSDISAANVTSVGSPATGTILNNDSATLTVADVSVAEGGDLVFTVTLSHAVQGGLTVGYATADGTATLVDSDYAQTSGTLTFDGTAGEQQTITVPTTHDTKVELDETLTVALSAISAANVTSVGSPATGTILNNDSATLTVADVSVGEGGDLVFTVTLSHAVQGGLTVGFATADGTATLVDSDYAQTSGTLTFDGTAGEQQTITVPTTHDTKVEPDETLTVALSGMSAANVSSVGSPATGTITNNDSATLTIADVSVDEGGNLVFMVTLSADVQGGVNVNYATADGTATAGDSDYTPTNGTLTFAGTAGEQQTITVPTTHDTKVEPDETLTVALSDISAANVTSVGSPATGTITNNDSATLTIGDVSVAEGGNLVFTVTLSHAVQGGLTVGYATADGTATLVDSDYTQTSGTLTFDGTEGEQQTITVPTTHDTKVEPDETLTVTLSDISAANVTSVGSPATGTILNNDSATLTIADVSVAEGGDLVFTVTLSHAVQGGLTVGYATADGTATLVDSDYTQTSGTLTFDGTAGEQQTITVPTTHDTKVELDETLTVALSAISAANVTSVGSPATGTITNNDSATLAIGDVSVAEGGDLVFTVTLSHAVQGGLTVDFATADGTATLVDSDYAQTSGTLTFDGTAGEQQTITVPTTHDTKVELDETLTVTLSAISAASVTSVGSPATGTILNNDSATLTIGNVFVAEGGNLVFTVTLSADVQGGVNVNYATADGTATTADNDYTAASGTLNFTGTAGEQQTITVPTTHDTKVEPDETLTVALSAISAANVTSVGSPATGTITERRQRDADDRRRVGGRRAATWYSRSPFRTRFKAA
jgi:ketosteroid isomerase-like protein